MEHAPPYHDYLSDEHKVKLRIEYELIRCKSGPLNLFFQNIAVIYLRLSLKQMENLRRSFGTIRSDFFEYSDFIRLLNAIASPLFITTKNKRTVAEAQDAADKARAAAEADPTSKSKANSADNAKFFAECIMAAKANGGQSAKANSLKRISDKVKLDADNALAAANADPTNQSKVLLAKSLDEKFQKVISYYRGLTREAEAIVKKTRNNLQQMDMQIKLYSEEFHRESFFSKQIHVRNPDNDKDEGVRLNCYKVYTCKYNPSDLELADAILNVAIFILQVLLPPVSVYDEERYKQHLRDIGICNKKSVDKLEYYRRRYIDELRNLSSKIKTFFRNGMLNNLSISPKPKAFHSDVFDRLNENESFMRFLWNTCDECQKPVDHLGLWRTEVRCTECGGECPIFQEPTPSAPAQDSDHLQALATELTTSRISFGPDAERFACKFLGKGIFQLSDLSFLEEETFASIVKEIGLNEVQVLKLSAFRKK